MTNDRNTTAILALGTAAALYVGMEHPALLPALTFAAAVFVALAAFLKL